MPEESGMPNSLPGKVSSLRPHVISMPSPVVMNSWQVMGEPFDLESRYKVYEYLGSGAYGVVCAAHDSLNQRVVAIKKCKKVFQSRTLAKRTLREIRLLRLLRHENVIPILTVLKPRDRLNFNEVYVVFELMETDLAQVIRSPQVLQPEHIQYFIFQILRGVEYLHSLGIVHRDLKPRNLLVNEDCHVKIADFGLARLYDESNNTRITVMTEYVTTRWYRAPEIIVGWPTYSNAVDVWAVGCILAELIARTPLFPGPDSSRQLELIAGKLGRPSRSFIEMARKPTYRDYLLSMTQESCLQTSLLSAHPTTDPLALDLLAQLLTWDPTERLSARSALQHPYLRPLASVWETQCAAAVAGASTDCAKTRDLREGSPPKVSAPSAALNSASNAFGESRHGSQRQNQTRQEAENSTGEETVVCCQPLSSCRGFAPTVNKKEGAKQKTNGSSHHETLPLTIEDELIAEFAFETEPRITVDRLRQEFGKEFHCYDSSRYGVYHKVSPKSSVPSPCGETSAGKTDEEAMTSVPLVASPDRHHGVSSCLAFAALAHNNQVQSKPRATEEEAKADTEVDASLGGCNTWRPVCSPSIQSLSQRNRPHTIASTSDEGLSQLALHEPFRDNATSKLTIEVPLANQGTQPQSQQTQQQSQLQHTRDWQLSALYAGSVEDETKDAGSQKVVRRPSIPLAPAHHVDVKKSKPASQTSLQSELKHFTGCSQVSRVPDDVSHCQRDEASSMSRCTLS